VECLKLRHPVEETHTNCKIIGLTAIGTTTPMLMIGGRS